MVITTIVLFLLYGSLRNSISFKYLPGKIMRKNFTALRLIIISLLLFINAAAQTNIRLSRQQIKSASQKLDSLALAKSGKDLPGCAVSVIYRGKKIYSKCFGLKNLDTGAKINSNSDFYLASVSKEFTTMAVMILHDRRLLNYDDPVDKYLTGLPACCNKITIRNLMTHTSGLPDYYALLGYNHNFSGITNRDVWNILLKLDSLNFKPGTKFEYSNSGFVLLSMIVVKVSRQAFGRFMKKNIFDKLGMKNTLVVNTDTKIIKDRAVGYSKDSTGQYRIDDYNQYTTGAGGIYSNVNDLYKWDQGLYTNKLVKRSTLEEAFTRQSLNNGTKIDYGFGWFIGRFKSGMLTGIKYEYHTGALDGFRNIILRIPQLRFSCIVLSNSGVQLTEPDIIPGLFFNK